MSIELGENGVPTETQRVGNGGALVIATHEALAVRFGHSRRIWHGRECPLPGRLRT